MQIYRILVITIVAAFIIKILSSPIASNVINYFELARGINHEDTMDVLSK